MVAVSAKPMIFIKKKTIDFGDSINETSDFCISDRSNIYYLFITIPHNPAASSRETPETLPGIVISTQ